MSRFLTRACAVLLVLALLLLTTPLNAQEEDNVSRVNDATISREMFQARLSFVRWEYLRELDKLHELTGGSLALVEPYVQNLLASLTNPDQLAGEVLGQMEEELLLRQAAAGLDVAVTPEDIEARKAAFFSLWTDVPAEELAANESAQAFIEAWYTGAEAASGLSRDDIEAIFADEALRDALLDTISAGVPTEEPAVHSRHILCSFHPDAPTDVTPPTDEQRTAAETCIQAALARLEAGELFEQVAADLSDDPDTGASGGDVGWVALSYLVESYADAVKDADLNTLIGPVETEYGLHLIEVLERQMQPVDETQLAQDQQQYFQLWIDSLHENATIERAEDWAADLPVGPGLDTLDPDVQAAIAEFQDRPAS